MPPRSLALVTGALELLPGDCAADDPSLVAHLRARDPAAFRRLFDCHGLGIWRFIRDLVGDASHADEGLQETFVRAFARIDQLRDDARLVPWLLGIARNVAMETLRARRRDRPPGSVELAGEEEAPHCPELLLLGREAEALMSRALSELGEERRAALLLRVEHGLPYEEIAQVMGWSLPKVKNEIHRARARLRSLLGAFHGEEP